MPGPKERERTLERIREICLALPGKRSFLTVLTNHHGAGS